MAHDDPDANTFDLYARGQMLVQDGGYAAKKLSSSVNTILVNGKGQKGWTQPLRDRDAVMTKLAHGLAWKPGGTLSVVEGEAAGAYAGLTRYPRTVIFAPAGLLLMGITVVGSAAAQDSPESLPQLPFHLTARPWKPLNPQRRD